MKATLVKRLLKVIAVMLVAIVLLVDAKSVHAMSCFTDLGNCYVRAAGVDSFWMRWAAGLDCELNFISCARQEFLGY